MVHSFSVTDSELLQEAPILALRRDTVTMPDGSDAKREIVEHFGAVAVVAFDGARIALVKQYRNAIGRRLWELPAGLLDVADEDPLVCAQRELQEEAGLAAAHYRLLVDVVNTPGICDEAVRVYLAETLVEVPRPEASEEEADMTLHWVPLEEAVRMVLAGEIHNASTVAGILCAQQVILGEQAARSVDVPFDLRPQALARRRKAAGITGDLKRIRSAQD